MAVPLPYPKLPEAPAAPEAMTGLPKFKRLFDTGPTPIQSVGPNYAQRVPAMASGRGRDRGPMSARAAYIRFLKEENVRSPEGLAAELLQTLQGGGKPLARPRADVLKLLVQSWLGE